jgi:glycerol-3-phosphate acyltransferase PlsY
VTALLQTPLFCLLAGYLLGSIPSGYLAGRWLKGVDIRSLGSGSTGATNVLRQFGKVPALVVFLVDVLKGTAAVLLAKALLQPLGITAESDWWVVAAGLAALAGHIWPVWLGGRGGKAVATGLGMLLGLAWPVGLACFGVFMAVISISRIVSLSSVIAALSLPLLMLGSFAGSGTGLRPAYLVLALVAMVLVLWRHRSNIERLLAGTEPRIGQKA